MMLHPILDQPEVLRVLFHPRREVGFRPRPPGVRLVDLGVAPGLAVGGRLHPADADSPAVLLFHGNGEIAADYDALAPLYTRLGMTLLVVDYRGYGRSGGAPTAGSLLSDAVAVVEGLDALWGAHGLAPVRLYAMGRSLGSAAAIQVALYAGDRLAGLIIESGFADTFALLARLGVHVQGVEEERDGFGNAAKMERVAQPTLILHGEADVLIPPADGRELYWRAAAQEKRLVLIPGGGHNDLMMVGHSTYFGAIQELVCGTA
jgi:pimeloyl-ACP methyl ester carboxylesterase